MKHLMLNTGRAILVALGATMVMSAVAIVVALKLAGATTSLEPPRPAPEPGEPSAAVQAIQEKIETKSGKRKGGAPASESDRALARAFEERRNDLQVEGSGTVVRILADDEEGSRHQRFILELATGQTLLVAHNVDLAPRIESLEVGDRVDFYGEYEWSDKGGVIHWTHHDPDGRHVAGWLRHDGQTYR